MNVNFDFRSKLLVIVLTMSLVAVLTSDILLYTLLVIVGVYLVMQGLGRQAAKYLTVCCIFIVLRLLSGQQGLTILMPEMFLFMALRLRKLLSWRHPLAAMEYIVTPVIFRSSRIAEELAASAESRGISNPGKHTCRRKIEFQKQDWIICVIAVCITALYFILERMVD